MRQGIQASQPSLQCSQSEHESVIQAVHPIHLLHGSQVSQPEICYVKPLQSVFTATICGHVESQVRQAFLNTEYTQRKQNLYVP